MREAFDIGEPRLEVGQNLQHAFGAMLRSEALGNVTRIFVGAADKSNWLRSKHGERVRL